MTDPINDSKDDSKHDSKHDQIESVAVDAGTLATLLQLRASAFAPYSDFHVAALIECPDGSRHGGCNVETSHYKSICAEASAISAMVAAGQRRIQRVWILADGQACCPPCGDCRQRLFEFATPGAEVLLVDEASESARRWTLEALLPAAFRLSPVSREPSS